MSPIVTIHLSLSRHPTSVLSLGPATLALVFAATAIADVPHSFAPGEVLSAADLNANFDDLDQRIAATAGPVITEWQGYDPVVTAGVVLDAVPDAPNTSGGYWRRVGDTLEVRIAQLVDCNGGSGQIRWSYPDNLTVDQDKGAISTPGSGLQFTPASSALEVVAVVSYEDFVHVDHAPVGGGVSCESLSGPTVFRMSFAVPVEGWTTTDG
jgi:hypothetical protein